jgi:hypothetical protein
VATFTNGQLCWLFPQSGTLTPFKTSGRNSGQNKGYYSNANTTVNPFQQAQGVAKLYGGHRNKLGLGTISGYAYQNGVGVRRLIKLFTTGPHADCIGETYSDRTTGYYSFSNVASGNYTVVDENEDNTRGALIWDWVVVP